jgi:hypothetical protein
MSAHESITTDGVRHQYHVRSEIVSKADEKRKGKAISASHGSSVQYDKELRHVRTFSLEARCPICVRRGEDIDDLGVP